MKSDIYQNLVLKTKKKKRKRKDKNGPHTQGRKNKHKNVQKDGKTYVRNRRRK